MRLGVIDAIRGAAILLMIVDHVAAVFGSPWVVRGVVTRFAMPAFMVTAGAFVGDIWRVRFLHVVIAAVLTFPLIHSLDLSGVPILVVFVMVYPIASELRRFPLVGLAVGLMLATVWPVGWWGYEPGAVLAWLSVGALLRPYVEAHRASLVRTIPLLSWAGRWPLSIYVFHLVALWLAVVYF